MTRYFLSTATDESWKFSIVYGVRRKSEHGRRDILLPQQKLHCVIRSADPLTEELGKERWNRKDC